MRSRTQSLALCGLSIALLSVGAAIILPLGPIPFTLQTLMLFLIILILTPKEAVVAVGGYLLLGAIGLPVFSGLTGGFGMLLGPTGGFLMGFFVGVVLLGLLRTVVDKKVVGTHAHLLLDTALILIFMLVYYTAGTLWYKFMFLPDVSLLTAIMLVVVPFIVLDVIKAAVAFVCAQPIRAVLGRSDWQLPTKPAR